MEPTQATISPLMTVRLSPKTSALENEIRVSALCHDVAPLAHNVNANLLPT